MAKIKGIVGIDSISRKAEGAEVDARYEESGALVTMDWKQAMIEEGRAFGFHLGSLSTGITGGGMGSVVDLDQPEFIVSVPTGAVIYPKRIHVAVEPVLALVANGARYEILIACDLNQALPAVTRGTSTAETPLNLNTASARNSVCTARSRFGVNVGQPDAAADLTLELAHAVRVVDLYTYGLGSTGVIFKNIPGFELLYEPDTPIKITGPAMLIGYFGSTQGILGYATVEWYEL